MVFEPGMMLAAVTAASSARALLGGTNSVAACVVPARASEPTHATPSASADVRRRARDALLMVPPVELRVDLGRLARAMPGKTGHPRLSTPRPYTSRPREPIAVFTVS